jgi:hypothetical protein
MGSRITRIARRCSVGRTSQANRAAVFAVLLGLALSEVVRSARAQSSDAGTRAEGEAHTTAATEPSAEAQAPAAPAAAEPAASIGGYPKTLTPQQRLPENLQGWMRERNRLHPIAERPIAPPASLAPQLAENPARARQVIEGYQRRLRSFDENGVTVLSNRRVPVAPEPEPQPVATAAIAVAATVPAPQLEEDPEPVRITETHSLRTRQKAKAPAPDQGLGWPRFAVPIAAIGLGLIWLRRRRQPHL